MDSRSAREPFENNHQLITISRPSTTSNNEKTIEVKDYEFRAVETIEEFFRPELVKQDDLNSQIFNTDIDMEGAESFIAPGANTTHKTFMDQTQGQFRMGFPDMSYLNPDRNGEEVQA